MTRPWGFLVKLIPCVYPVFVAQDFSLDKLEVRFEKKKSRMESAEFPPPKKRAILSVGSLSTAFVTR